MFRNSNVIFNFRAVDIIYLVTRGGLKVDSSVLDWKRFASMSETLSRPPVLIHLHTPLASK